MRLCVLEELLLLAKLHYLPRHKTVALIQTCAYRMSLTIVFSIEGALRHGERSDVHETPTSPCFLEQLVEVHLLSENIEAIGSEIAVPTRKMQTLERPAALIADSSKCCINDAEAVGLIHVSL